MKADDVEKGIELSVELMTNNIEITKVEINNEPTFLKRIVKKFKTADGKDCACCIYVGFYSDVKDLRIFRRAMTNWAKIRKIPLASFQDIDLWKPKIENQDTLTNLKHLDLSNNKIKKIEGLENLTRLETLNLSSNKIKRIEGINNLSNILNNEILNKQIKFLEKRKLSRLSCLTLIMIWFTHPKLNSYKRSMAI